MTKHQKKDSGRKGKKSFSLLYEWEIPRFHFALGPSWHSRACMVEKVTIQIAISKACAVALSFLPLPLTKRKKKARWYMHPWYKAQKLPSMQSKACLAPQMRKHPVLLCIDNHTFPPGSSIAFLPEEHYAYTSTDVYFNHSPFIYKWSNTKQLSGPAFFHFSCMLENFPCDHNESKS